MESITKKRKNKQVKQRIVYGSILVFGLLLGMIGIDAGHILFSRFWLHNIYVMYLIIGATGGLMIRGLMSCTSFTTS